ncbi:MAG TPA: GSU2403 family nucleotidyltransferase fold protein [Thermoanaerobaculia bacterium]|nr:GSU2403 family nucleotidyltransferase fold protein [Thermoanaerobaculia bacterium]
MAADLLPDSVRTLYAELLDLATQDRAERTARDLPAGTFVAKEIRGARYWYLQISTGGTKSQRYLGRETQDLLRWMETTNAARGELQADAALRERLVAMLVEGGAQREDAAPARALELLADLGIFLRGGVLIGTHAFQIYGNLLGVRFEQRHLRTADIDIAHDLAVAFALRDEPNLDTARAIGESGLGFLPVPGLDPRVPSTSYKVRGRELRIDFLAPAKSAQATAPVQIPGLGLSAQPLVFLDYLIEDPIPALVLRQSGILVQVPTPARYALHKLWVARQRPAAQQVRAAKDRQQAEALLDVLIDERPEDLRAAWGELAGRKSPRRQIAAEIARLSNLLPERLAAAGVGT